MSHTAFADSLIIVGIVVGIVTAWAALPHPAVGQAFRIFAKIILFGAAAWVLVAAVIAIVASRGDNAVSTETSVTSTTPRIPPPITYPPAPEPAETSSMARRGRPTETQTVSEQPVSKPEWKIPPQPLEVVPSHKEVERHREPEKLPQDKWTLKRDALSFMERSDWPGAISAWTTWISTYSGPDKKADHTAYLQLGLAYERQHDWSHAIHALERANVIVAGDDAETLVQLGRCYEKAQRWSSALEAYEEALRIEPQNALASHGQAVARRYVPR
jgi:hypothetical protein